MMKKFFSGGGNDKSSWVGKVLQVGKHQCFIEEIIAEGGYALVFLVKSSLGHRYALKRVSVNELHKLEICKQEINILKKLSGHRNTILFIDSTVNVLSPGIYEVLILMEYCRAGHVVQLMNECIQTGFTEKMVMRIFCDVCEAIVFLHSSKPPIIHRDLKVENVLRKQSGDFVLCDFGSAYFGEMDPQADGVQNVEDEIASCTTLPYRAPEMVDLYSGHKITTKADIWALGCFLYKLCFFTTPFGESTLAIQNGQFTFPEASRFSEELYSLIKMMLVVDQDKRPDIHQVLGVAFRMLGKPCPVKPQTGHPKRSHNHHYKDSGRAANPNFVDGSEVKENKSAIVQQAAQVPVQPATPREHAPVSTSLAPRSRPKGVNKFSTANDVATPTPFKSDGDDSSLGQPGGQESPQVLTVNPFEDDFSANGTVFVDDNTTATNNPFDMPVFSTTDVSDTSSADHRVANYRSHFRSRSDTFTDLARRASSNDDDRESGNSCSNHLKPGGELYSTNKSVPDMRTVGSSNASQSYAQQPYSAQHSTSAQQLYDNRETFQQQPQQQQQQQQQEQQQQKQKQQLEQQQRQREQPQGSAEPEQNLPVLNVPFIQLDLRKPRSQIDLEKERQRLEIRSKSEPTFEKSLKYDAALAGANHLMKEKVNRPSFEEADASPLLTPSLSAVERQYIYTRTSSCSSEDLRSDDNSSNSDSSHSYDEDDGRDGDGGNGDLVNYLAIRSSSSSSSSFNEQEDDGNVVIKDRVDGKSDVMEAKRFMPIDDDVSAGGGGDPEDVFGSAPFSVDSLKITVSKKQKKARDTGVAFKGTTPVSRGVTEGRSHAKDTNDECVDKNRFPSSANREDPFSNADPFVLLRKNLPAASDSASANEAHSSSNNNANVPSQSKQKPVAEDPFGSAPFIKIVKHKKPLSSQELTAPGNQHQVDQHHRRVQQRRRVLPKSPIGE
eukprot:gene11985-13223_t